MSERLRRDVGQSEASASPREAAFLELQRAASELMQAFARRLRPHGLTPTRFNVL